MTYLRKNIGHDFADKQQNRLLLRGLAAIVGGWSSVLWNPQTVFSSGKSGTEKMLQKKRRIVINFYKSICILNWKYLGVFCCVCWMYFTQHCFRDWGGLTLAFDAWPHLYVDLDFPDKDRIPRAKPLSVDTGFSSQPPGQLGLLRQRNRKWIWWYDDGEWWRSAAGQ